MVLVEGKKYSCETCIKGHRSSNCKHTDRPLFEIQKKGRPPTQCAHCRALRKTRQVHVKCMCASANPKEDAVKKGTDKILETPAFPHGLEATAVLSVDGQHSDSGQNEHQCRCDDDGQCSCCMPRKSAPRTRKKINHECFSPTIPASRASPDTDSSTSSIAPRTQSLRRLAPKVATPEENVHLGGYHGHDHGFNPYGRAYETAHLHHNDMDTLPTQGHLVPSPSLPMPLQTQQLYVPDVSLQGLYCACGHVCRCSGCGQAEQDGANPPHCGNCLECTLINMGAPPQTDVLGYPADINVWVQQAGGAPDYTDADLTPANTYDWSALDTSADGGNCCGGGGVQDHLVVPELSRSRSSSDSDSSWADIGRPLEFFELYDFANMQQQNPSTSSFVDVQQQQPEGVYAGTQSDYNGEQNAYIGAQSDYNGEQSEYIVEEQTRSEYSDPAEYSGASMESAMESSNHNISYTSYL